MSVDSIETVPATDEADVFANRAACFERVYDFLNAEAPDTYENLKPSPRIARHDSNEALLVTLLENGVLPWFRSRETPTQYSEERGVTSSYGLQLFFSTCTELIVEKSLSESEVRQELNETIDELDSFDGSGLPSDGTVGQAKASMRGRIKTMQWLLGEYDE